MATYKGIKGVKVQSLASDPPAAQSIGQLWYNTASDVLKYSVEGAGAWSTGGSCNERNDSGGYCGIQTACMYGGGRTGSPLLTTGSLISETYDGTSWTTGNNMTLSPRWTHAGFGSTTAAIMAGGYFPGNNPTATTLTYDGTSFSAVNDINTSRNSCRGAGTSTAGIIAGGSPVPLNASVETYDGTSYSTVSGLTTGRSRMPLVGTTTAALCVGGTAPGYDIGMQNCETYDGSSWSEQNDTTIPHGEACASGTTTAAMTMAGMSGPGEPRVANTEQWNGTSWTEVADLATARKASPGSATAGTTAASCIWGGTDTPVSNQGTTACEEWNEPVLSTKTVTVS